jgi:hypothetical protein
VVKAPTTAFNPATLTRDYVLQVALADPIFRTALQQLKGAEGFGPDSIRAIDDHTNGISDISDVIVVVRFDTDGTPSAPRPGAVVQNGSKHLPAWITYGRIDGKWGYGSTKNPLYVSPDNKIHISRMATGNRLVFRSARLSYIPKDGSFDRVARLERKVYVQAQGDPGEFPEEQYDANVYLTVPELAALL